MIVETKTYSIACNKCGRVENASGSSKKLLFYQEYYQPLFNKGWYITNTNDLENNVTCPMCNIKKMTEGKSKNKQMKLFLENINFYEKEDIINFLININNGSK